MEVRPDKALFKAIKNNSQDDVRALVAAKPGLLRDAASGGGMVLPVGYAVQNIAFGDGATAVEMVLLLCELGADVNGRGSDTADTPLLTAVMESPYTERLVEILLARGADPRLTNIDGNTALQETRNPNVQDMLRAAAARPPPPAPAPAPPPPRAVVHTPVPPPQPAPAPAPPPAPEPAPALPAEPAGPITEEGWARLDRFQVKDRAYRLKIRMTELGDSVMLADFEVIRLVGTGANAFVYLAKCRLAGQLAEHTDTLVVLKVLLHYKQPGGAALDATSSLQDRTFVAAVREEVKGPNFEAVRPNFVHVLGHFTDDGLALKQYLELDPEGDFVDPNTAFIVMPLFSGGDLQKRLEKCQAAGALRKPLEEKEILDYLMQILDAVDKLLRVGQAHRDIKPDNLFFTPKLDGIALGDFGELGLVQLEFTKGVTSPGGAPGNLAPEVTAAIEALADSATATIDYSKNDVFAVGIVAYKMVSGDNDAEPWADGVARTAETMRPLPEGCCSPGLKTLIEDGLLNPVVGRRMSAADANLRATDIALNGGRASQVNASVMQQVTPRTQRDVAQLVELSRAMGGIVTTEARAEVALRQAHGNVGDAWAIIESSVEEGEPPLALPAPPDNAEAVAALAAVFQVSGAVANEALQASGGDPDLAADFLRARHGGGLPSPHQAPAPPQDVDDATVAELLLYGFAKADIIQALIETRGDKEAALELLIARSVA